MQDFRACAHLKYFHEFHLIVIRISCKKWLWCEVHTFVACISCAVFAWFLCVFSFQLLYARIFFTKFARFLYVLRAKNPDRSQLERVPFSFLRTKVWQEIRDFFHDFRVYHFYLCSVIIWKNRKQKSFTYRQWKHMGCDGHCADKHWSVVLM